MPVSNLARHASPAADVKRCRFELLSSLNFNHKVRHPDELELDARIASFELAARMQLSATEALDLTLESPTTPGTLRARQPGDALLRHPVPDGAATR